MILVPLERIVLKSNTVLRSCLKCKFDTAKMRTWLHSVNEHKTLVLQDHSYRPNWCIHGTGEECVTPSIIRHVNELWLFPNFP